MLEVDIAISRIMLLNSRRSYSDIGKELGLIPYMKKDKVEAIGEARGPQQANGLP